MPDTAATTEPALNALTIKEIGPSVRLPRRHQQMVDIATRFPNHFQFEVLPGDPPRVQFGKYPRRRTDGCAPSFAELLDPATTEADFLSPNDLLAIERARRERARQWEERRGWGVRNGWIS